jgi:hypothetical protein
LSELIDDFIDALAKAELLEPALVQLSKSGVARFALRLMVAAGEFAVISPRLSGVAADGLEHHALDQIGLNDK